MTTTIELEGLFVREMDRCRDRIEECEARDAALGHDYNPSFRAAIDRDRDRAFIALRRAMKALKELRAEVRVEVVAEVLDDAPVDAPVQPVASKVIEMPQRQIARNALCPCSSGDKYKRCCGRDAPPLTGDFRRIRQGNGS